jgi:hypothetical protein
MLRSVSTSLGVIFCVTFIGCVEQTPDMPSEEDIKLAKEHILTTPPTPKHPVGAELDDKLEYLGLDVDTDQVTPGKAFQLTHYWRVKAPVSDNWKVFVHLEAPGSKKNHLNADHVPIAGKYPVVLWKQGEIIRDIHRVSVPQNWPGDGIEIYVGMWKGNNRMKVTKGPKDAENRIMAITLPVAAVKDSGPKKRIIAKKIKPGTIKLDGKLDEAVWKQTPSSGEFVRTTDGAKMDQSTTARVLWDDQNLYVGFEMTDKDVWTTLDKRDDKLWTQEAVEMFIDADGNGKTYVELQTNPKGAIFDSYLPAYRQNQNDFDSGMKVAVKVDGTVDVREDQDKGWTVEMMIPLAAARGKEKEMKNVPPQVGTEWRVNFYRMDSPAGRPQQGSGWSPPLVGDFHALDRFGVLVFGDEKVTAESSAGEAKPEVAKDGAKPEQKTEAPAPESSNQKITQGRPKLSPAQAARAAQPDRY